MLRIFMLRTRNIQLPVLGAFLEVLSNGASTEGGNHYTHFGLHRRGLGEASYIGLIGYTWLCVINAHFCSWKADLYKTLLWVVNLFTVSKWHWSDMSASVLAPVAPDNLWSSKSRPYSTALATGNLLSWSLNLCQSTCIQPPTIHLSNQMADWKCGWRICLTAPIG